MSMSKGGGDKELKGGDDKALPKNTYDFGYHRKDAVFLLCGEILPCPREENGK